ncbi:DUF421 domain-containing protein [Auraticoccus monumenti]|uniref:DUF421 domain-containing protein n=1 Tax=Auraticoccus monumenti TaxID=675864 RepID=A0A1G6ZYG2_9ACTN|nr:YetF domain-containing protein [Auraticoccus monumenti]SDE07541.1 Protein of unknown function [Auraticoccus monumenti]
MLFDTWYDLLRILAMGVAAYVALLLLLRVSGKRTLSKLNAFDFVITVALGSTLATVLLSSTVSLAEGLLALALLVALQWGVAFASSRSRRVERLVKTEPALLYRQGFLTGAMRRERVTADELRQAARASGHADLEEVAAVVLETDGTLSVLTSAPASLQGAPQPGDDPA